MYVYVYIVRVPALSVKSCGCRLVGVASLVSCDFLYTSCDSPCAFSSELCVCSSRPLGRSHDSSPPLWSSFFLSAPVGGGGEGVSCGVR